MHKMLQVLNRVGPGFQSIYERRLSSSLKSCGRPQVGFTAIKTMPSEDTIDFINGLKKTLEFQPNGTVLDLEKRDVLRPSINDIELGKRDKFGKIMLISEDDIPVRYGESGISSSPNRSPSDLLTREIIVPAGSFGVLDIEKHTPFLIDVRGKKAFAASTCELEIVPDHQENIKRYSLDLMCPISVDDAKRLNIEIQKRIFHDYSKETFYEEVTSKVYKPTVHNRSSGTLMSFESEDYKKDKSTSMHYHPGERSLHIFTTKKPAGVTLNFCGVAENPDDRKDSEVHLRFPENSMTILNFPPYTHHKFHGEFVCMSVHPREGSNLIESLQSGTLPSGFLESATVFSSTKENTKKWNLSIPDDRDDKIVRSR